MADEESVHELSNLGNERPPEHITDTERLVPAFTHTGDSGRESFRSGLKGDVKARYHQLVGVTGEHKKYVIKQGFRPVFFKIWIHAVPLAAIVPIAVLNILGYYIGPQLRGSEGNAAQNLSNLGLQLAAKLFELVVGASLALTVMDIIRYLLIHDNEGIPLGILVAQDGFSRFEYLWSAEFWFGRRGLSTAWQKFIIPLYIILVGTIMVLVGPAAAVLIIPNHVTDFEAGGTKFWLAGSSSLLWPKLVESSLLPADCLSPTPANVTSPPLNLTVCPWSGYPGISGVYEQWRTLQGPFNNAPVVIEDSMFTRHILQHRGIGGIGMESWCAGSDLSIDTWSAAIAGTWNDALVKASVTTSSLSRFRNYGFMDRRGTAAAVTSDNAILPAVRTSCLWDDQADSERTQFKYPILQPYQVWSNIVESFFLNSDSTSKKNATDITAQWLPIPSERSEKNDGQGTLVSDYPSALLQIRVPRAGSDTDSQIVLSCSIDARWAPGFNRLGLLLTGEDYHYPELTHLRDPKEGLTEDQIANSNQAAFGFLPADDGSWTTAKLGLDWLNNLTPQMDPENEFHSTLTNILESIGIRNNTGGVQDWGHIHRFAESVISTMVVDGLSRIGLSLNVMQSPDLPAPLKNPIFNVLNITGNPSALNSIILGTGDAIGPPENTASSNRTELDWSITITGLAYRVNDTANILALTLLFIYATIAVAHIIWSLARRQTSRVWSSSSELLLLGQNSPPAPHILKNTSTGIEDPRTYSKTARIRVVTHHVDQPAQEEVQLLWEKGNHLEESRYRKIQPGREYGAFGGDILPSTGN